VKIHPIETGTVRIKARQRVGRGRGGMRQVNILFKEHGNLGLYEYTVALVELDRLTR
jgi:hypothetical protein